MPGSNPAARSTRRLLLFFLTALPTLPRPALAQPTSDSASFSTRHAALRGLYRTGADRIVIGQLGGADVLYYQDLRTGAMRFLGEGSEANTFRYSPTRDLTPETEGVIRIFPNKSGTVVDSITVVAGGHSRAAARVDVVASAVTFRGGPETTLSGTLLVPSGPGPHPAAVIIPQADRFDLWDVAMWVIDRGVAVLIYDQRNHPRGASRGPTVSGRYQDEQREYASDARGAVRFLTGLSAIDPARVGIVGWSGGGFTGALVAAHEPQLAFYVNIAGDASPGFEQAAHLFASRLMREGFSDADVGAARAFITLHFGVPAGRLGWREYEDAVVAARGAKWFEFLTSHYSVPYTREAGLRDLGDYQASWPPERTYGAIARVPTLGIFFAFDHSSPPSTPGHFFRALREAANPSVAVAVIPDTNHGGFVLGGMGYRFDTRRLTGRSPHLIATLADWIERQCARERQPAGG